jgi:hypothetical protein
VSRPIDMVLSRLDGFKLRENGRDRWRACCPGHDGSNPSALSVGIGQDDQVLLRCWQGCDVERVVQAMGLDLSDLFPPKPTNGYAGTPLKRRRLLTAGQALDLLDVEITLTMLVANDIARGELPDATTRDRLLLSAARVSMLRTEASA